MKLKLFFLGSGSIAVPIIERLYSSERIEVCGICTQEDKPAGRKRVLTPTEVGIWAQIRGIGIMKAASVNTVEFTSILRQMALDFILVVSFGQILKQDLLGVPRGGCINIHASLLPKYRGASPIVAAILNGEGRTGVSFMQMERGLDSGPVFRRLEYPLKGCERSDWLERELGCFSAAHVEETLLAIYNGELKAELQDSSAVTIAGKVKKSDGLIEWDNFTACKIERMTRAYSPWPGAYTYINTAKGKMKIIITSASVAGEGFSAEPGSIVRADRQLEIAAASGSLLRVMSIIPEGRKEMTCEEFLRGTRVEPLSQCASS